MRIVYLQVIFALCLVYQVHTTSLPTGKPSSQPSGQPTMGPTSPTSAPSLSAGSEVWQVPVTTTSDDSSFNPVNDTNPCMASHWAQTSTTCTLRAAFSFCFTETPWDTGPDTLLNVTDCQITFPSADMSISLDTSFGNVDPGKDNAKTPAQKGHRFISITKDQCN